MRSIDKMLKKQNERREQLRRPYQDEPDEVEITVERERSEPINSSASKFDRDTVKKFGGINTAPSVFEKYTVFRVTTDES
jgi:hypothetical protein